MIDRTMLKFINDRRNLSFAVIGIAARRVVAQRGLAVATLLGLLVAIGLTISIPVYAESVYYRMLSEGLFSDNPGYRGQSERPPVSLLFRYVGAFTGPKQWHELVPLSTYFEQEVYDYLRLPPSPQSEPARLVNSGLLGFYPEREEHLVTEVAPEYQIGLAALDRQDAHLSVIDGAYPSTTVDPTAPLQVLVSRFLAEKMGIQVGERYVAYDLRAMRRYEDNPAKFTLRVAGVWEPKDPDAEFWEYTQLPIDNMLFIAESAFEQQVSPKLNDEVYQAMWYIPLDASAVFADDVDPLLLRLDYLQRGVNDFLPNTNLDVSPIKVLQRYQEATRLLTFLLFAFGVPVLSLILTFVGLVVALNVERQRHEVAALRSRGATVRQVIGIGVVESGLLGILALAAALPAGLGIAYVIGRTRSFLDFSLVEEHRLGITWGTARFGLIALFAAVVAQVLPLISSARHTIVSYKTERARRLRPPWWQRTGLDLLLLAPAGYGTYLLRQQGSILMRAEEIPADPFQNPLLFLVPALSLLVGTLLILRVLPLLVRLVAWIVSLGQSIGPLMAMRQLARAPSLYAAPLSLLILTLSLSTYSASLAATLDNHLHDQQHYWVGADASIVDTGDTVESSGELGGTAATDLPVRRFLPVSDYLKLPGVEAAARLGRHEARVQTAQGYQAGTYMGVDRTDFAAVAFWRDDFGQESLGGLMNHLALREDAVLLPREFMQDHILNVGDTVNVAVQAYGTLTTMPVTIVGSFDYFPGWYPETGPLAVGNLDYFHREAQMSFPYRVWLKTASDVDFERLEDELWELNLGAEALLSSRVRILREQQRPERQGLLGMLSVGFSAAAVLTALGFIMYALFSFRRRAVELGVLRAVGLSASQMTAFVATELAILLIVGSAAGTGLGIAASKIYVPFLQVGAEMTARVPPFVVEIAWPALLRLYALFAVLFVLALIILVRLLRRMKLFQAIKLGETT